MEALRELEDDGHPRLAQQPAPSHLDLPLTQYWQQAWETIAQDHVSSQALPEPPAQASDPAVFGPQPPASSQVVAVAAPVSPPKAAAQEVQPSTGPARRRLNGKQPRPVAYQTAEEKVLAAMLAEALDAEEDADEPGPLASTVKRKHIHWTFVETANPQNKQPLDFSRAELYAHIEKCYKEVYPRDDSPTGTILTFGCVAMEKRAKWHYHVPTFSLTQHYWNKVAKLSLEKYRVPLNAVAHTSYATMYAYVCCPTKKKPFTELDHEVWHSKEHPRHEDLTKLLKASQKRQSYAQQGQQQGGQMQKRQRLSLFEVIKEHNLHSVTQLLAHACELSEKGSKDLAEFCSRQGHKLEEVVHNAWSVIGAPKKLLDEKKTLMDKLFYAASGSKPCVCGGRWAQGAEATLRWNMIDVGEFCRAVVTALRVGAKRGVNVACVGSGGCGKSTLLEVLEIIFDCAGKPEEGSTFPLASLEGFEVILWQDYEHHEGTVRFTDLLSWFLGESVGVRRPGTKNQKFRNAAPCFYSGRAPLHLVPSVRHSRVVCEQYNNMMDERFKIFEFCMPLPKEQRVANWPACGRCAAQFFLHHGGPNAAPSGPSAAPILPCRTGLASPAPTFKGAVSLIPELERLAALHASGALDAAEFKAAKQKVLQ